MNLVQHAAKLRIMFLLPFAPRLDAPHGGGRTLAEVITRLAAHHEIALIYLRAAGEQPIDKALCRRCAWVHEIERPLASDSHGHRWRRRARLFGGILRGQPMQVTDWNVKMFAECVRAQIEAWQPNIVQIEFSVMAQYLNAMGNFHGPRILTIHEPGAEAAHDQWCALHGYARLRTYIDMLAWRRFEGAAANQATAVVVFTERDRQAIATLAPQTSITKIPLGTVLPAALMSQSPPEPASLLFVGSFIHPPNIDAAIRLAATIFPHVRARCPQAVLYIVGDQPPSQLLQLASEHVIVTGRVPAVAPYLDRAALVVVPLRQGGGMRVKVLEALAAGKALVASSRAIEGLMVRNHEHVVLAESDDQFADAVVHLLADTAGRAALGERAQNWARDNLCWDASIAAYEALYRQLM
jgi:glycosyltransferase involved in cell wall biosynthesis